MLNFGLQMLADLHRFKEGSDKNFKLSRIFKKWRVMAKTDTTVQLEHAFKYWFDMMSEKRHKEWRNVIRASAHFNYIQYNKVWNGWWIWIQHCREKQRKQDLAITHCMIYLFSEFEKCEIGHGWIAGIHFNSPSKKGSHIQCRLL